MNAALVAGPLDDAAFDGDFKLVTLAILLQLTLVAEETVVKVQVQLHHGEVALGLAQHVQRFFHAEGAGGNILV